MKKLNNIGLIGLIMRLGGSILCGVLLEKIAVGNFFSGCNCFLIVPLYFLINLSAYYVLRWASPCITLEIISILIGVGLAYVAIDTGHLFCSGVLIIIALFSVALTTSESQGR